VERLFPAANGRVADRGRLTSTSIPSPPPAKGTRSGLPTDAFGPQSGWDARKASWQVGPGQVVRPGGRHGEIRGCYAVWHDAESRASSLLDDGPWASRGLSLWSRSWLVQSARATQALNLPVAVAAHHQLNQNHALPKALSGDKHPTALTKTIQNLGHHSVSPFFFFFPFSKV